MTQIKQIYADFLIPLGMNRLVEKQFSPTNLHSVGMQPKNGCKPNGLRFCTMQHFLPSEANLRLANQRNFDTYSTFYRIIIKNLLSLQKRSLKRKMKIV